jgi:tetratricopeptide (TPR) repeat protein
MDSGLIGLNAKQYSQAAAIFFGVYQSLPLTDARRDLASYHLAEALFEMGITQAAIEHYLEIVAGRRTPELMDKALSALKRLYERRLVHEDRFVEGVLYGGQYADLSPEVADFVEYFQALTDVRHGFEKWGRARLETLAHTGRLYSFSARYALAVEQVAKKEDDAAATELRAIATATAEVPFEIKNQARIALGRILYEKKSYEDAWQSYSQVDSPLPLQDVVMVERAWDRVASGDQQRALGLLVGLGAPVFHDVFAPERYLIRGIALRRLCQYRAAHVAAREFRRTYGPTIEKIRARTSLKEDLTLRKWAVAGTRQLREYDRILGMLTSERAVLGAVRDKPLHDHLDAIYAAEVAAVGGTIDRGLEGATEKVAEELLRIDEQMSLVDYEIGAGLFKSSGEVGAAVTPRSVEVPYATRDVYFKFDGEFWSDELRDYSVLAEDRCVR